MMVGRGQAEEMQRRAAPGVRRAPCSRSGGIGGRGLKDISLTLREGEILGVAGLEGQGQRAFSAPS